MKPTLEAEICILGGGPAGAVVARRLAEVGRDTVLVDRAVEHQPPRAESLAPSVLPIVNSLGLGGDVDAAIFCRESRALVRWDSAAVHEKTFAAIPSLLIERPRFDGILRRAAARVGVRVLAPARAHSPQRLAPGGWVVPVTSSDGPTAIKARFLVDARGKRHHRGRDDGVPTAAISASWLPCDRSFAETRIEAGRDAWFWGSPLPHSRYDATIFLDPKRVAGIGSAGRTKLYRQLLSGSQLLKGLLRGEMSGPVRVRDATPRMGTDPIGNDFIRTGEAAVAIDPLSSQGIQEALLAAIQASAAVHTMLTPDGDHAAALEFYREHRQAAATRGRLNAARFYQPHADRSSFWMRRSLAADGIATGHAPQARSETPLPSDLCLSQALRIVETPVLLGALIRRAPALSHPGLDRAVAYFGGVALAPLVQSANGAAATEQILSRWTRHVPPETARNILTWMWTVGLLDPRTATPHDPAASARRQTARD